MKKLNKILLIALACIFASGGYGCSQNGELYQKIDNFIQVMDTSQVSANPFAALADAALKADSTSDGQYIIMPMGQGILVGIAKLDGKDISKSEEREKLSEAELKKLDADYEKLSTEIKSHYESDDRVKSVHIDDNYRVIAIDCSK